MKPIYGFGQFRLDPTERLLLREGQAVALTPKAFDLLVCLVEHQGRLVEKATLIATLWPGTTVEEANLAFQISTLRKALEDGANSDSLIQTVPTKGYRFTAQVTISLPSAPAPGNRRLLKGAAVGLLAAAAGIAVWVQSKSTTPVAAPAASLTAPAFTQLTANPPEVPVNSQAISPDGKYLAYCDRTGIKVEVIDSGEVQALPETRGMEVFGWSDDGTKIRAIDDGSVRRIWEVSLVGSARRPTGLALPDEAISIAPDVSCFLKLMPDGELRIEPVHGAPRSVMHLAKDDRIHSVAWTPDGKRVFFVRERAASGAEGVGRAPLETVAVDGGGPSTVFTPPRDQVIRVIGPPGRDGKMIAFMGERGRPGDINVWEMPINVQTGKLVGEPRRLTDWREMGCHQITRSADGRRVALLTGTHPSGVYVAAFDAKAPRLDTPRRLTMSDRHEYPTAWTLDNRSIIFSSARAGRQMDIYKQDIDGKEPQLLVTDENNKNFARVTGDGRWLLFIQSGFPSPTYSLEGPTRVMRVPIEGGIAEEIYATPGIAWPQCSIAKGCIVYDQLGDRGVISVLDPIRGKGAELATVPTSDGAYILAEGTELAYIVPQDPPRNHIRIISFVGKPTRGITVPQAVLLKNLDPLPDGSGWLSVNYTNGRSELLYIRRDGRSHVLWVPDRTSVMAAIPSRDGKHLAIETNTTRGNVWMMTRF